MSPAKLLAAFAIAVAFIIPLSSASTVTLTGGCPQYVINSTRSYITFNVTNAGDGSASNMQIYAAFGGINASNSIATIQQVEPGSSYSRQFYLFALPGSGSYVVNMNATYMQAGTSYATVFPCIIYVGGIASGPLEESVFIDSGKMVVNITSIAQQSIMANVVAVVPPSFSVKNSTRAITVAAQGHLGLSFGISSPTYTDATFPVIAEISYEYNGTHYAQMGSAAFAFGSTGAQNGGKGGGIGLIGWALILVVAIILILIVASIVVKRRGGARKSGNGKEVDEAK